MFSLFDLRLATVLTSERVYALLGRLTIILAPVDKGIVEVKERVTMLSLPARFDVWVKATFDSVVGCRLFNAPYSEISGRTPWET